MRGLFALLAFFLLWPDEAQAYEPDLDDDDDDDDDESAHGWEWPWFDTDDDDQPFEDLPEPPLPPPGDAPLWPLPGVSRAGKPTAKGSFATSRGGTKLHTGIDLGAPHLSPIVAPEPGFIVAKQGWDGPGAKAVMFVTVRPDGPNILFGAIEPDSHTPLGVPIARGGMVARVGRYPHGSTMLHLETYKRGTKRNKRWFSDRTRPEALLDPTPYVDVMVTA